MATGTEQGPGHDPPDRPMTPEREAVQRLVLGVAHDVAGLEDATLARLAPALIDAQRETAKALAKILAGKDGSEKFTAQQYRRALVSLEAALDKIAELKPAMLAALGYSKDAGAQLAAQHTKDELARLGAIFGESIRPTQIATAAVLSRTNALLIPKHKTSAARYANGVHEDIRHQLALGLARGETYHQLTERLRRLGGPKGLVALRGIAGEPGAVVEEIAEGLFTRYRHWAERVVRSEVGEAYNIQKAGAIDAVNADLDDDEEPFLYRWDAAADRRVCPICRDLDRRVALPGKPFVESGVAAGRMHPPAHPNCRCVIVAWHASWGDIKGEVPTVGEVPTGFSKKELTKYHPAPPPAPGSPEAAAAAAPPPKAKKAKAPIPAAPVVPAMTAAQEASFKDKEKWVNEAIAEQGNAAMFKSFGEFLEAQVSELSASGSAWAAKGLPEAKLFLEVHKARAALAEWEAKHTKEGRARARAEAKAAREAKAAAKKAAAEEKLRAKALKGGSLTPAMLAGDQAAGIHGVGFVGDGAEVENNAVKARRVKGKDGVDYYEFTFKLTPWQEAAAQRAMVTTGKAKEQPFSYRSRELAGGSIRDTEELQHAGRSLLNVHEGGVEVELGLDGANRNAVRIRVRGKTPSEAIAAFEERTKELGVVGVNRKPNEEERELAVKGKVVGKFAPQKLPRPGTGPEQAWRELEKAFDEVAAEHPIALEILKDAKWQDVGAGHQALYSKALAKHMATGAGKVKGLIHDSSAPASVLANMLQHGGMASAARFDAGIFTTGMSTSRDFETGGADGFFTRVVTARKGGSRARFQIDKAELGRLDWWAFDHDMYGAAGPNQYGYRWKAGDIRNDTRPASDNEVMFPKGIAPSSIKKLELASAATRAQVIEELRRRGVTEIGGRPIEEVVVVK